MTKTTPVANHKTTLFHLAMGLVAQAEPSSQAASVSDEPNTEPARAGKPLRPKHEPPFFRQGRGGEHAAAHGRLLQSFRFVHERFDFQFLDQPTASTRPEGQGVFDLL
jgi:purine nucleoside permease